MADAWVGRATGEKSGEYSKRSLRQRPGRVRAPQGRQTEVVEPKVEVNHVEVGAAVVKPVTGSARVRAVKPFDRVRRLAPIAPTTIVLHGHIQLFEQR